MTLLKLCRKINEMAKNMRQKGKSVKNGNAPSPYLKYQKAPYQYGESYKQNYLLHGVLHRNGRPVKHKDGPVLQRRVNEMEAAE